MRVGGSLWYGWEKKLGKIEPETGGEGYHLWGEIDEDEEVS